MPFYKFTLPDGRAGRFEAKDPDDAKVQFNSVVFPDMMRRASDPTAPPAPDPTPRPLPTTRQLPKATPEQIAADKALYDPAKGMPWWEKALAGAGGGMTSAATGIGDLIGLASPEAKEERKEWDERKGNLGNWGTAGEILGEAAMTAPVGGPVAGAGKLLTKAVPALSKVAGMGGKYLNIGTAARAAAEGGASAGLVGSSSDEGLSDRAEHVAKGLGMGLTAPAVMKLAALPIKMVAGAGGAVKAMLAPSATALERKVYDAFKATIGEEGITNARRAMEHAEPSMVPHTTAAMAESPGLGALERGARGRSLGPDFAAHDESIARATWDMLGDIPLRDRTEAGEVLKQTFKRNGIAQTPKVFGKGADQVPDISSLALRKTLGKLSPHLSDTEKDTFVKLADDLMAKDIVKTGTGHTAPQVGGARQLVSAGLALASAKMNSPMIWKVRSAFNTLSGNAEDTVVKKVDEALLDPDKFMNLVDTVRSKIEAGMPLTKGEELFKQAVEITAAGGGRAAATPERDKQPKQGY
jgi:hypothetical protein